MKGSWKAIAFAYKLNANSTNAGFLLKQIYYRNLVYVESHARLTPKCVRDPKPLE